MDDLRSAIQSFNDFLKFEKRYSRHTLLAYQDDLEQFATFLQLQFETSSVVPITAGFVRSWLASLKDSGVSARSINRKLSSLKSFFKYMVRMGVVEQTPMATVVAPKAGKRLPGFAPEADLMELIGSLQFTEDWKGLNARMLFSLFYATGMRLSELIQLKESQIDRSKQMIKILGKGNKERLVPVSAELLDLIGFYEAEKRKTFEKQVDVLLVTEKGARLYPKYAYLLVNHYLKGIKTLERKSPHILRHSFATHLTNHGAGINAVKELLGHASLASTQVYTHNSIEKLKEVYRKAHPREQKP
jgi:integrase/recombinase XerC